MPPSLPQHTSVLVVGAGPTGLLLAAELQRRQVPTLLIEARPEALHWDRATVIHPLSLEIFEALGLEEEFLDAGCRQRHILIHADGERLGELDLAGCGSRYGFNLGLSEEITERLLSGHLQRHGGTIHRGWRLIGLEPHGEGVIATIASGEQLHRVQARWVVGCDGLRSTTRELAGIAFDGEAIARPWAVFDAGVEGWRDSHEANAAYLDATPLILTALPGRRWRVYLRPSSEQSDLVTEAGAVLQRYLPGARFTEVENPSRFHCHTRVARAFHSGAVFVAGDAAHVCSPAEGHGMNCGLQDAANLGWKLALVHHGTATPALLDSYGLERRPVAERITRSGAATEQAHGLRDPQERAARNRAIAAMLADPVARQHEVVAETEMNVGYAGSPILCEWLAEGGLGGQPGAGQRLPTTIRLSPEQGGCHLHTLTQRPEHTLVLLGSADRDRGGFDSLRAQLETRAARSALPQTVVALRPGPTPPAGAGLTLLAVRPDGFIGLRAEREHLRALDHYERLVAGR
ncbi:monooxygenase [Cyanobium sp. PCC 7001]|uniref:FAD-dependent oxidoreductase n=1 Tax=Cyanobium sp. PCC 7001 TaxID=180281 RepID=UPI00018057EA|nr:FAD-dependent monooxygenase [Cyanobium sp. PCC 7001]EDY39582.1 monooxygenase [Cyanobium sp. PCC 7001]